MGGQLILGPVTRIVEGGEIVGIIVETGSATQVSQSNGSGNGSGSATITVISPTPPPVGPAVRPPVPPPVTPTNIDISQHSISQAQFNGIPLDLIGVGPYTSGDVDTNYVTGAWKNYTSNSIFLKMGSNDSSLTSRYQYTEAGFVVLDALSLPAIPGGAWKQLLHVAAENRFYLLGLGGTQSGSFYSHIYVSTSIDNGTTWATPYAIDAYTLYGRYVSHIAGYALSYGIAYMVGKSTDHPPTGGYTNKLVYHFNKNMVATLVIDQPSIALYKQIYEKLLCLSYANSFYIFNMPTTDTGIVTSRGNYTVAISGVWCTEGFKVFLNNKLFSLAINSSTGFAVIVDVENNSIAYDTGVAFSSSNMLYNGRFAANVNTLPMVTAYAAVYPSRVMSSTNGINWSTISYPLTISDGLTYGGYEEQLLTTYTGYNDYSVTGTLLLGGDPLIINDGGGLGFVYIDSNG